MDPIKTALKMSLPMPRRSRLSTQAGGNVTVADTWQNYVRPASTLDASAQQNPGKVAGLRKETLANAL